MDWEKFWRYGAIAVGILVVIGIAIAIGVSAAEDDEKDAAKAQESAAVEDDLLVIAIALETEAQDEQLAAEDLAQLNEQQQKRAQARQAYLAQLRQVATAGAAAGKAEAEAQANADNQEAAEAARQAREQLKADINALRDQAADESDRRQQQNAVTAYEQLESALASGGEPDSSAQQAAAELEQLGGEIDTLLEQAGAAADSGDIDGVVAALEEIGDLLEQAAG